MTWTSLRNFLLLFIALCYLPTMAKAQAIKPINIFISGIKYDNPDITSIKEYLKTNVKVKHLKSSFTNSVTTLSFSYNSNAGEFWDEVPANIKEGFNLTSLDGKTIKLQAITSNTTISNTTKSVKKDCGDCAYFPVCNYDVTKTYSGKEYRGIRGKDESIVWYNCDNGTVTEMQEFKRNVVAQDSYGNFYDTYETAKSEEVILKSNAAKGDSWKYTTWKSGDGVRSTKVIFSIADKLASVDFDGKKYLDIIKVRRLRCNYGNTYEEFLTLKKTAKSNEEFVYVDGVVYFSAEDFYYSKNNGLVKRQDVINEFKEKDKLAAQGFESKKKLTSDALQNHWFASSLIRNEWAGSQELYVFMADGTVINIVDEYDYKTKTTTKSVNLKKTGKWRLEECDEFQSYIKLNVKVSWYGIPWGSAETKITGTEDFFVNYDGRYNYLMMNSVPLTAKPLTKEVKKMIADAKIVTQ